MTTFHLVRHASHGLLGRVLTGRMSAVGLSEAGHDEVEMLAEQFADENVDAILSSPSRRAIETAEPIAWRLDLNVQIAAELDEIDFGGWAGATFEDLADDPLWERWNEERSAVRCPDGETMIEAQSRIVGRMQSEAALHPDLDVILVSHGDMIKSALAWALGLSLDNLARLDVDPASTSVIRIKPWGARVMRMNVGV